MDHALFDHSSPFTRLDLGDHSVALPKAFMLAFNITEFNYNDYDRHGITMPASIARSVPKRQAEYLAGRRVALAALRGLGCEVRDLPIGADRAPCWPPGYIGSISHAAEIAVAIALLGTPSMTGIGIDIERIGSTEQTEAIRSIVLDADEQAALLPLATARGWPYALTLAFSAKESFYKATAATIGHFIDFGALRVEGCDTTEAVLNTRVTATLSSSLPIGCSQIIRWTEPAPKVLLTSCVVNFLYNLLPPVF